MFSGEGFSTYSNDDSIAIVGTVCHVLISTGQGMKAIDKLLYVLRYYEYTSLELRYHKTIQVKKTCSGGKLAFLDHPASYLTN